MSYGKEDVATVISLPEEINGMPVVKIASLLTDNDTVKELYIPKTIRYISISSNVSLENIYEDPENTTFFQMMAFYIEKMAMTILA